METKDILLGLIGIGAMAVGGYSIYKSKQMDEKIDKAIDKIANGLEGIDISETILQDAVDRAVDKHSKIAAASAVVQIKHDILDEARKCVDESYNDVKGEVKKELQKQIGDININKIRDDVVEEAAERAADKFDDKLDDILEEYNGKLKSIGKIYDSIADSMSGHKTDSGINLKIGG